MTPRRAPLLLCLLALGLPETARGEQPYDDAEMLVEYRADEDIAVGRILAAWATKFDALVVQGPQVQTASVRFLTHTNRPITWGTMKAILDFHGVVVLEEQPSTGGPWVLRAAHRRNLATQNNLPRGLTPGEELPAHEALVTAVFQIQHGAGNSVFATVRGLASRDQNRVGNILYVQGPELLIVVDLSSRVRYYASVIEALDVAGPRQEMEVFQIDFAPVERVAEILGSILEGHQGATRAGGPVVPNAGQGGVARARVIPDPRSNQLAVLAFPIDMPLIRRVIAQFDVRVPPAGGQFHVYRCRNVDAKELAARLQELFVGQGAPGGAAAVSRPVTTPSGVSEVETRIVADEQTNTLLIQAEPAVHEAILRVLAELDRKPRRVLIEVLVYEVSTPTDQLTVGVELAALTNAHEDSTRPAAATSFGLSSIQPRTNAAGDVVGLSRTPNIASGLTAVLTRDSFDRLPVILSMIQSFEQTNLITRPFMMTNDNKPAEFSISDSIPFRQVSVNQGVTVPSVSQVEASTTLSITPQVNSEDNLTLQFSLTISSFSGSGSVDLPPGTNSRTYSGEAITVPNNSYVVFGGLDAEGERTVEDKLPLLGDIPVLGHLFKNWSRSRSRSQVYIFVRPTILADADFATERRLGEHLREEICIAAERDTWLPPVLPQRLTREAGYSLQDEAFEVFGSGSGSPFAMR